MAAVAGCFGDECERVSAREHESGPGNISVLLVRDLVEVCRDLTQMRITHCYLYCSSRCYPSPYSHHHSAILGS